MRAAWSTVLVVFSNVDSGAGMLCKDASGLCPSPACACEHSMLEHVICVSRIWRLMNIGKKMGKKKLEGMDSALLSARKQRF